MGNQSHRENKQTTWYHYQWFGFTIIDTDILVVLFSVGFLYGFGYPLVLKSWFSCLFGFLYGFGYPWILESWFSFCLFNFLYGFGYPSRLHTCIALVFSMVLHIAFATKVVSSWSHILVHFPVVFALGCLWFSLMLPMAFAFTSAFNCGDACPPWAPACTEEPSSWMMFSPPREHVFQNKCPRADENTASNSGDLCELQMVLSPRREHHFNVWMWTHRSQNDALACTRTHVVQYVCYSKGFPHIATDVS